MKITSLKCIQIQAKKSRSNNFFELTLNRWNQSKKFSFLNEMLVFIAVIEMSPCIISYLIYLTARIVFCCGSVFAKSPYRANNVIARFVVPLSIQVLRKAAAARRLPPSTRSWSSALASRTSQRGLPLLGGFTTTIMGVTALTKATIIRQWEPTGRMPSGMFLTT